MQSAECRMQAGGAVLARNLLRRRMAYCMAIWK